MRRFPRALLLELSQGSQLRAARVGEASGIGVDGGSTNGPGAVGASQDPEFRAVRSGGGVAHAASDNASGATSRMIFKAASSQQRTLLLARKGGCLNTTDFNPGARKRKTGGAPKGSARNPPARLCALACGPSPLPRHLETILGRPRFAEFRQPCWRRRVCFSFGKVRSENR